MTYVKYGLIGLIGLIGLGFCAFFYLGMQSQGGTALGLVEGRLAECPASPNCVSSETDTQEDKKVEPLPLSSWDDLPAAITDMGGSVTTQEDAYLAAEFSSSLFGFVDDVEFRLTETGVQVRSGSRVGHSDAGVNKARVAELRDRLGG